MINLFKIAGVFLVSLILVVGFGSFDYKNDHNEVKTILEKMNQFYMNNDNFSLEITYQAKKDKLSGKLLEVKKGTYHQLKNEEYFFEVNNVITISKKNLSVIVDKNTKRIVVSKIKSDQQNPINLNIEESLKYCTSIKQEQNRIDLIYSDKDASPYHKLVVYYDPVDFSLKRVILFPKQLYSMKKDEREYVEVKTVLDIQYSHYNQDNVTSDMLDISAFVKKKNNNYSPQNDYSNYELINQIQ